MVKVYILTKEHLQEKPSPIREGMCLASWEQVSGFSWDLLENPDKISELILPSSLVTLKRVYDFDTSQDSPNYGGFGTTIQLPARRAVWHWWGTPSGQNPYGIINWLVNPRSMVSAHAVVWPNNVACIVNYDQPSWANGNTLANITAITLEADPNNIESTIRTGVEYLGDLVRQNVLAADFELSGHRDWSSTVCPGDYYPRLSEIRTKVDRYLADYPNTTPEEKEMDETTQQRIYEIWYTLTKGETGKKATGDVLWNVEETVRRLTAQEQRLSEIQQRLSALEDKPSVSINPQEVGAALAAALPDGRLTFRDSS